jgi:hypothetical protein
MENEAGIPAKTFNHQRFAFSDNNLSNDCPLWNVKRGWVNTAAGLLRILT